MHGLDARDRGVPLDRRGPQDGDERAEVLADDDVGRHGEGRLVALARLERRPVRLCEAGERDGEREERRRDPGCAGRACERHAREAGTSPSTTPSRQAPDGRQQARGSDGDREGDEARQHEERRRGRAARRQVVGVHRTAHDDRQGGEQCDDRREVERPQPSPAARRERDGHRDHGGGDDGSREPQEQTRRRENALREHRSHGSVRRRGRDGASYAADDPAGERAAEADGRALRPREKGALPATRSVPGEPASGRREIAPERARGEHGERDEERRSLSSHEQQAASRDGRDVLCVAELLGGKCERP